MKRLPLAADFILFIALCASLAYWGMQFFKPQSRPVAPPPQQVAPPMPRMEAAAGLFGGRPAGAVVASNFQLKGVISAGPNGVAILAADGKPPQAVGVGMEVEPGVTVKEVQRDYVLLNEGGMIKRVDLPQNASGGLDIGGQAPAPVGQVPPPMPAPTMEVNNGQMPSQQPPVNNQAGMAPQPVPMQPMMPPPAPMQPGPNEAPNPGGIPGGGHPGLQK